MAPPRPDPVAIPPRRDYRPLLICAVYLLLHLAAESLSRGMMVGPRVGIRQSPGLAMALLILCGPRYFPVVLGAHVISFFAFHHLPSGGSWLQLGLPLVASLSYAATAWAVRRGLGSAPVPKSRREVIWLVLAALAAPLPWAVLASSLMPGLSPVPISGFLQGFTLRWLAATGSILTIVPVVAVHVAPWLQPGLAVPPGRPLRHGYKTEVIAQVALLLGAFWLVHAQAPLRALRVFMICVVPLAWISISWGLAGATLATLVVNLGTYFALRVTGGSQANLIDFLIFSLAYAGVGLGLGTIITLRNQSRDALAESEERLAQALAGARLGSWDWDMTAGTVTRDRAWAEMLGYQLQEIPLQVEWWQSRVHPDDLARVNHLMNRHLSGHTPYYEADFRVRTAGGAWKWIHDRGAIVARGADGRARRVAGTQLDLTDRKQAEAEKTRLLAIIEASTDFIGTADLDHRVIYVNPALKRLVGMSEHSSFRHERIGDIHPAWAAKIIREEALPAVLAHGSWTGENALLDAQGREIPVSQLILLQRDDDGQPAFFSTIARDISKPKEIEAGRLATERKLLQAQKLESLGVLAGGIAHDFNNLLTVMLGNASLAEMVLPADSPAMSHLQMIRTSAVRAAELCKQMLAYSGKGQFTSKLTDLSALVETSAYLLKVSISKKCVLTFDLARGLPPVRVDATQVRQIVVNLVTNASDAISERSGLIRVATGLMRADAAYLAGTYLAPDLPAGDYVYLEVTDDGSGMTPEVAARIFEPFFTTKFIGRGLGLPAVLGIVRAHGGALKVVSEAGRGSTFRLLLPAAEGEAESGTPPAAAAGAARGAVLVVDDEETVRTVAARILESCGYRTVLAADGREALKIFRARPGDFRGVLLDLTMPHMNGEEAFHELRALRPDLPVILMSGFSEEDSVDRFAALGLAGFVPKPFDRETLVRKVRAVLEHRA